MKNKKAFTLSELLIALTMILIVISVMAPVLKSKIPDTNKSNVRQAYGQILKITQQLLGDVKMYPDTSGFTNTSAYTNSTDGETFSGGSKFADLFKSQLNIADDNVIAFPANTAVPVCCTSLNNRVNCITSSIQTQSTCFTTNNNITYCLPKNTDVAQCFRNADADKFNDSTALAIVKVYFNNKYTDKDGYYFTISSKGKVSILPINIALNVTSTFCANNDNYKDYNQCKLNDYLLYTNPLE